ncbi:MAG: flagellar biosynthesis/type III secretory pathway protein, partial [Nitrospirae bacterium]|nr:flagellar biosynthesis/type III secretory pathway protein [Nitrospirota bacterium]
MSSQYYDLTLKGILKDVPKRFFKIITGFEEATFLDVQFPSVKYRQVDLLVERPDKTLLHIELQSYNDSDMDWRMLDY